MAFDTQELLTFLSRFDRLADNLRDRARNKPSFELADEYDVQDLVYAALKPVISDLTKENPCPKVASLAGRVDLYSRALGVVVEIKATLKDNRAKQIPQECVGRVKLYSGMPGLARLIFFIYDPTRKLDDIDSLHADLVGPQHRNDRSGDFEIDVVGSGLPVPMLPTRSTVAGASIVVDDVKPFPSTLGVVVGLTVTVARGTRLDGISLRLGKREMSPTEPPGSLAADDLVRQRFPTGGIAGPDVRDVILYFGPTDDGSGIPVTYGSSGLLELRAKGQLVGYEPIDLPELPRPPIDDADARIKLSSWFCNVKADQQRKAVDFAETDTKLGLPAGTAARLLVEAVAARFEVGSKGKETVIFKERPHNLAISLNRPGGRGDRVL